jgi:formylglycine-generating enzyme required for sulfatase activity
MSGNVLEWCEDVAYNIQNFRYRRIRGGSWGGNAYLAYVDYRGFIENPVNRNYGSGFRLARSLPSMVMVQGGRLPSTSEFGNQTVESFQIGRCEVTLGEWKEVRDWAVNNNKGYDMVGEGGTFPYGSADNFPVVNVSWYDAVKWCNARSEKEGLTPVYRKDGTTYKAGQVAPTVNSTADGYRLPSEKEWEWAARGGVSSRNFTYSGSNTISEVGWTYENSSYGTSYGTKAVGTKAANELGIYDMSGNVWEWCEDFRNDHSFRQVRGGSWDDNAGIAAVISRFSLFPDWRSTIYGFRVARSSGN